MIDSWTDPCIRDIISHIHNKLPAPGPGSGEKLRRRRPVSGVVTRNRFPSSGAALARAAARRSGAGGGSPVASVGLWRLVVTGAGSRALVTLACSHCYTSCENIITHYTLRSDFIVTYLYPRVTLSKVLHSLSFVIASLPASVRFMLLLASWLQNILLKDYRLYILC